MIDLATLPADAREEAAVLLATDPEFAEWARQLESAAYYNFQPRPDDPANFDQQSAYVNAKDAVSFLLGGNFSGKTSASALKCSRFLLSTPPPRPDTPFWIVAQTYEQCGLVCWKEKLCDGGFLPRTEVDWDRISWRNAARGEPASVPLKPWPNDRPGAKIGCNWMLEFKSVEQGRAAMQARSIGGFWFSEQFPLSIFLEILRGCRDYFYPGGQFAEFTPIDPDLCLWVEQLMDKPPENWGFYRCNSEANKANIAEGIFDQFFGVVPDEMIATRMTGALASFEGVIYQTFSTSVHVVEEGTMRVPDGAQHFMGTDWGASAEHPHATVLGCRDAMGDWYVYDEYWSPEQGLITLDHCDAIIEICDSWGWPTELWKDKRSGNQRLILSGDDPQYGYNFADPSRPGEINEFNAHGIPTAPAINRVYDGINTVRSLLKVQPARNKPKLFISRRCKHVIEEMRKYRWLKGKRSTTGHSVLNPKVAAPQPLKRDDDTVDGLRYMVHSAEKSRGAGISSADQLPDGIQRRSVKLDVGQAKEITEKNRAAGGSRSSRPGWFNRKG